MLLQVLIGYSGEKRCKKWKTHRLMWMTFKANKLQNYTSQCFTCSKKRLKSGVKNLLIITGRMNCALALAGRKINLMQPKIMSLSNYEEEWLILTCCQGTWLSWTLTWVTKILIRAISSIHVGRRFSTPRGAKTTTVWGLINSEFCF